MGNLNQEIISSEKLQAALEYIKLGWHVLPLWQVEDGACACGNANCKSPGKHPISRLVPHGQDSATTDTETLRRWFSAYPEANLGIYLAPSGLCAVDIDVRHGGDYTMEELEGIHGKTESDVLQLTGGGGEHRIFKLPSGIKLPGTLGKGIDLKSNGYIVVEPSNHVSGGVYEWEASSNPLEGAEPSELPEWIKNLANASASQPATTGGDPINFGMTSEQYEDAVAALPFIPADERDVWTKVGMALHSTNDGRAYDLWCQWSSTSDKYDHKDQYRVWRSFKHKGLHGYDLATVFYLAQENGWVNVKKDKVFKADEIISDGFDSPKDATTNEFELPEDPVELNKLNDFDSTPKELLTLPVEALNSLLEWVEDNSQEPQREISIMAVLSIASVVAGRNYISTHRNTSSLFFMLLAPTGVGKNYAKESVESFLIESQLKNLYGGSGNTSPGAVLSALYGAPCHIQIVDEVGKQLASARKATNGQMAEALSVLTEAYSATTRYLVSKNYSQMAEISKGKQVKTEPTVIMSPGLTLFNIGTPGQVFDYLTSGEIEDGYLNRQIVVLPSEDMMPERYLTHNPLPNELAEWAQKIRHTKPGHAQDLTNAVESSEIKPTHKDVHFEHQALGLYDAFNKFIKEESKAGNFEIPELTKRWRENAMRLGVLLAVADNCEKPVITKEFAEWSISYVWHYGKRFMKEATTNVADNDYHRLYLNILGVAQKAGSKGVTQRDISRHNRLFRASRPHDREQALKALITDKEIIQVAIKKPGTRGRPRVAFMLPKYFKSEEMELLSK